MIQVILLPATWFDLQLYFYVAKLPKKKKKKKATQLFSEVALLLAKEALTIPEPYEHLQSLRRLHMGIMSASKYCVPSLESNVNIPTAL